MRRLYDVDAEAALLGSVLRAKGEKDHLVHMFSPIDFHDRRHVHVLEAMQKVALTGGKCDLRTVTSSLETNGIALEAEVFERMLASVMTPSNAEHYGDIVRELSILRQLVSLRPEAYVDDAETSEEAISALRKRIDDIDRGKSKRKIWSGHDLAMLISARFEAALNGASPRGLPTGFHGLDRLLGGLRPCGLYILAARPGVGKTALALNIALNVSMRGEMLPTLIFSLEMSAEELGERVVSSDGRIGTERVAIGRFDHAESIASHRTLSRLSGSSVFIDARAALPIDELIATAKYQHNINRLGLVVVDYLQLVRGSPERRKGEREQEVAEVSRKLKWLAKDLDCPVLAVAQLNRDLERREDKRPRLSDLRESGSVEQDADAVLALYRPAQYDRSADENIAEVIALKHRHGGTGAVRLRWSPEIVRFDNTAEHS